MDLDYSINGEVSRFIYIKNILSPNDLEILGTWLQNKSFISGKCISGKEIPRNALSQQGFD